MKTKLTAIMLSFMLTGINANAASPLFPTLDNYRIPTGKKGALIAKIMTEPGQSKIKYSIKDTSGLFCIDKNGEIKLKPGKSLETNKRAFRYGIKITAGKLEKEFELVKDEFIHNKVVAHRGAWKNTGVTENSQSSLKNAIALGAEASEFDVWLAADNVIVVNHDPHAGGLEIEKSSSADLTKVPLKNGDYLTTLEEYLKTARKQNKTALYLEIKKSLVSNERLMELTEKTVKMVHDMKMQAWVNYISFDLDCLKKVMEVDPTAKTSYVEKDKTLQEMVENKIWGIDYNISMFKDDPELIQKAHKLGLTVNAWTVNKEEDLRMLLDRGIDFITTNEPELLLKLVNSK
jgi:glycerophosphoryl diester phosphodiesterase